MKKPARKKSTQAAAQPAEKPKPAFWPRFWSWVGTCLHVLHGWFAAAGRVAIIGFFTRYWLLLAVIASFVALLFSGWLFANVGPLIWLPAVGMGGWAFVLLVVNVFFRRTIDRDFDSGRFAREWDAARPEVRLILTVLTTLVLFLGYCLIALGLAMRT
jgi:hypothetical protein